MSTVGEIGFSKAEANLLDSVMPGGSNWAAFIEQGDNCKTGCPYFGPCSNIGGQGPKKICSSRWRSARQTPMVLAVMRHVADNIEYYNRGDFEIRKGDGVVAGVTKKLISALKDVWRNSYAEGDLRLKKHLKRERDSSAARDKKLEAMVGGSLTCEACKKDFLKLYGEVGLRVIECHHQIPLSSPKHSGVTLKEDLSLLCANCHAIAHSKKSPLSVGQVAKVVESGG